MAIEDEVRALAKRLEDETKAIEKRMMDIEKQSNMQESTLVHISDSLDDIKNNIKDALSIKGKMDNHEQQLTAAWKKIDHYGAFEIKFGVLESQHKECMARQVEQSRFISGRLGNLLDKLLPVIITLAALALATKEGWLK